MSIIPVFIGGDNCYTDQIDLVYLNYGFIELNLIGTYQVYPVVDL